MPIISKRSGQPPSRHRKTIQLPLRFYPHRNRPSRWRHLEISRGAAKTTSWIAVRQPTTILTMKLKTVVITTLPKLDLKIDHFIKWLTTLPASIRSSHALAARHQLDLQYSPAARQKLSPHCSLCALSLPLILLFVLSLSLRYIYIHTLSLTALSLSTLSHCALSLLLRSLCALSLLPCSFFTLSLSYSLSYCTLPLSYRALCTLSHTLSLSYSPSLLPCSLSTKTIDTVVMSTLPSLDHHWQQHQHGVYDAVR